MVAMVTEIFAFKVLACNVITHKRTTFEALNGYFECSLCLKLITKSFYVIKRTFLANKIFFDFLLNFWSILGSN